jgi:hypothetical protein
LAYSIDRSSPKIDNARADYKPSDEDRKGKQGVAGDQQLNVVWAIGSKCKQREPGYERKNDPPWVKVALWPWLARLVFSGTRH